jgi:hypothetical protein
MRRAVTDDLGASAADSAAQHSHGLAGKGEAVGHDGDRVSQQSMAQSRIFAGDALIGLDAQRIENAIGLGLDRGASFLPADRPAASSDEPSRPSVAAPQAGVENFLPVRSANSLGIKAREAI